MTSPRKVIRYRLVLRVIRRRSHTRRCATLKKNKHRLLNGVYFLARSTEKDITGFFEKAACGKAFSAFFINPYCLTCSGCDTFSFFVRTEKDIR